MAEDAANGGGFGNGRDHVPASTAGRATQDVFAEDAEKELGPGELGGASGSGGGLACVWRGRRRSAWDDQGAQGRAGGKDAVVGEEVLAGMGDQGGKTLEECGTPAFTPFVGSSPFQGGFNCVGPPIVRMGVISSTQGPGDCDGVLVQALSDAEILGLGLVPGDRLYAQFWFRQGVSGLVAFTDAAEVPILP